MYRELQFVSLVKAGKQEQTQTQEQEVLVINLPKDAPNSDALHAFCK